MIVNKSNVKLIWNEPIFQKMHMLEAMFINLRTYQASLAAMKL